MCKKGLGQGEKCGERDTRLSNKGLERDSLVYFSLYKV